MFRISPEIIYQIRETLCRAGLRSWVKWSMVAVLTLWVFWSGEATKIPKRVASSPAIHASSIVVSPPQAVPTTQDLREMMTARQTSFYWEGFLWAMQQRKELESLALKGRGIFIVYTKDAAFVTSRGVTCHPFSEKIIIAGKYNLRRGIGCNVHPHRWCRQMQGEKTACRRIDAAPDVLDAFSAEMDNSLFNFHIDWNRHLGRLGFYSP